MPSVEAELKRQPQGGGSLVAWELVNDAENTDTSRADPVKDYGARARLDQVRRAITDYEVRLDYDTRTDGNPVYVGKNTQGTATATATWTIQKLTYDASNRLTRAQVLTGSWDGRAALGWT